MKEIDTSDNNMYTYIHIYHIIIKIMMNYVTRLANSNSLIIAA